MCFVRTYRYTCGHSTEHIENYCPKTITARGHRCLTPDIEREAYDLDKMCHVCWEKERDVLMFDGTRDRVTSQKARKERIWRRSGGKSEECAGKDGEDGKDGKDGKGGKKCVVQ